MNRKSVALRVSFLMLASVAAVSVAMIVSPRLRSRAVSLVTRGAAVHSISSRLEQYGPAARERWQARFRNAGVAYPPAEVAMVGFKLERRLEVYARGDSPKFVCVHAFDVLGASGTLGPKLREGDGQVPEGLYAIESLNPNSRFHLSLRLDYPNTADRARAATDGRTNLGGDIMIHGGSASIGCLAVGDEAAEDLFVLVADVGVTNVLVALTPVDFRKRELPESDVRQPTWAGALYHDIQNFLAPLPVSVGP